ncbi:MAG TPA: HD domain-containing phosphohydrolase [Abditibacteriaceae bacterium]|jgi:HD-GYP domain-containing protein (c-di-GMP phosphodiesterase class II)
MAQWSVTAWNQEPDQTMAEGTRLLLDWLRGLQGSDRQDSEGLATQIAIALRDLTAAQTVAVFSRETPGDAVCLLSVAQGETARELYEGLEEENIAADSELFDATLFSEARFAGAHLWANLPSEPFFVAQAPAHLQVILGEVCDWANTFARTDKAGDALSGNTLSEAGKSAITEPAAALPALAVPLLASDDETAQPVALALLWIATPDGLLPSHLQVLLETVALHAGEVFGATRRVERLGRSYRELAELLASAAERREPNRSGHAEAMAFYAGLIARELRLSNREREQVEFAALLHEVGKLGVPDAILQKSGKLTPEELETVRVSVVEGADWLAAVDGLVEVAQMVRHQHERFDGKGTPDGLAGDTIPVGSRILAVALRFTAMTQPRADRGPMSVVGGALDNLAQDAGNALDPKIVQAFLSAMGRSL